MKIKRTVAVVGLFGCLLTLSGGSAIGGGSSLPACTTGQGGTLRPVLADLTINQGLGSYTATSFAYTPPGGTTTATFTATGRLARGKDTLVKAYLTLPSGCTGTINVTGASLSFSNGTSTFAIAPQSVPGGALQAAVQTNSAADPLFTVPAANLTPGDGSSGFTGTFTVTVNFTQNKLTAPVSTALPARTAAYEKKTNALRLLVVPMGDASQTFASQFPASAQTDVQNGMSALNRIFPVATGLGDLSSTAGGIRYTVDTAAMLDLRSISGAWNTTRNRFCGTQVNWPAIQTQLNQFLQSWNTANPSATADRVMGVVWGGTGGTSSTAGATAATGISDGSSVGCAEGMGAVNSSAAWVRAIDDNPTVRPATVSYTGPTMAMELIHGFGGVPSPRSTTYHSPNAIADSSSVPKAFNLSSRAWISTNHSVMKFDTTSSPWDNSDTVLEQPDYQDMLCWLTTGGGLTSECGASTAVGTTTGVAAGPKLVGSGFSDGTPGGTEILETYFTTTSDGPARTPTCPTSTFRLVQLNGSAVGQNNGICFTDENSAHTVPDNDSDTVHVSGSKSFTFSVDAFTGASQIEIVKVASPGDDPSTGVVLYARSQIAAPTVESVTYDHHVAFSLTAPTIPPKPDILFLADTTGSMQPALDNVKTNAANIMNSVLAERPGAQFGVAHYRDFNCDADPFAVDQTITATGADVQTAINSWSTAPGVGCDTPEAGLYAAQALTDAGTAGWRAGASKILVLFGDAPSHDPICQSLVPASLPQIGDVTLTTAKNALVSAGVRVVALSLGSSSTDGLNAPLTGSTYPSTCAQDGTSANQASTLVSATNGFLQTGLDSAQVASAIVDGLGNLPVSLAPSAICDSGLSLTLGAQSPGNPLSGGTEVSYPDATIHVAPGTPVGTRACTVTFSVNGAPDPSLTKILSVDVQSQPGTVNVTASSPDPSRLRADVLYACGGVTFPVAVGLTGAQVSATQATFSARFDPTLACGGTSAGNLVAYVTDGFARSGSSGATPEGGNPSPKAPVAAIYTPDVGGVFFPGQTIHLTGTGKSPQTGELPDSALSWTLTGAGGSAAGRSADLTLPAAPGDYTLRLTATDSIGSGTDTRLIHVVAPPSIAITHSPAGATTTNPSVTFTVSASDGDVGLSAVACTLDGAAQTLPAPSSTVGAAYTATITSDTYGLHSVSCTATNAAARQSTASDQTHAVYQFIGFLQPVDNALTNTGKQGKTYPVKWQLKDSANNYVTSIEVVRSITYTRLVCGTLAAASDALEVTSTGGSILRYDSGANQFVYNWQTPVSPEKPACYRLDVTLTDDSVHSANFKLN